MKIKMVEVSSGFANIPNGVCLAERYGSRGNMPGSAYDEFFEVELPDGYEIGTNEYGELCVYHGKKHVELVCRTRSGKYVEGVSLDGFHYFPIVD